jgi:pyruvate dehydrogenase E1 component alpha subunit
MKNLNLELYKKLYLIRQAENAIIKYYNEDEMKTPMHMSMGSEAIVVGVCEALGETAQVLGSYRSHALYLVKTQEINTFFAEMYGKETGRSTGKAGSMHLSAPEKGLIASSAVVASTIPVAIGVAFANKYTRNNKIVAVFFGDGAIDEGNFWESLNMACSKKLPIIFVCEDNDLAVHNPKQNRHGYKSIVQIVKQFNCHICESDTTDVEKIYTLTQNMLTALKKDSQPAFMHLKYYRYLEHVGVYQDFDAGYREQTVYEKWKSRDPIDLQRKKLLKRGITNRAIENVEKNMLKRVEEAIQFAKTSPFAKIKEVYTDVFYE